MRFPTFVFTSLALVVPALSAPAVSHVIQTFEGTKTGRYIVQLRDGVSIDSILTKAGATPTHKWDVINGFAGEFNPTILDILRGLVDVKSISEDGIMHTTGGGPPQTNAPWGLARLSSVNKLDNQDASALNFKYTFDQSAGKGVDIYVVDTGVRTTHKQFGGRARWGATFGGYADADGNGHGTHCAGTAAGEQFGVAKKASIIAVKVLGDDGSGSFADIISGLDYVATSVETSGRPSIASMSLGGEAGSASRPVDDAVRSLIKKGIHVIVAAGNDDEPAEMYSPAHVREAITVGASTIGDVKAEFSNYGNVVDIFAPGQAIISAWKDNDTATKSISGTSMATPHVAGLVAYLIGLKGNLAPAVMSKQLQQMALKNKLSGVYWPTPNLLAHNA